MVREIESAAEVNEEYEAWHDSQGDDYLWQYGLRREELAELRQSGPYIWVTWLTKLLVGENSCEWAGWFRAQHEGRSWDKVPSTFDQASWLLAHTAAINECRQQWENEGHAVFTENQNSLTLRGNTASLGGKPDLIAKKGKSGTIIDIKTGKPSPAHSVQVMLYMYAVPRVLAQYKGITFDGKLVYNDHEVDIPSSAVDKTFVDNFTSLIGRLASATPARKVPSVMECQYCDISSADCSERQAGDVREEGTTDDF